MSYGKSTSAQELDPKVVEALTQILGLDVSPEEVKALTTAYLNQLAAIDSIERFDLHDIAPILKMEAGWDE